MGGLKGFIDYVTGNDINSMSAEDILEMIKDNKMTDKQRYKMSLEKGCEVTALKLKKVNEERVARGEKPFFNAEEMLYGDKDYKCYSNHHEVSEEEKQQILAKYGSR